MSRVTGGSAVGDLVEPVCFGVVLTGGGFHFLEGVGDLVGEERAERLSAVVWDSVPASAEIRMSSDAV